MTIAITAATGQLGQLVVEDLLRRVPANELVLAVRTPAKAAAFLNRGVEVRRADYDEPDTLATAFAGVDKVLLISGSEVGKRVPQHTAAVHAASTAGVSHLIYTSAPFADTTTLSLAPEHKATEQVIRTSGVPFTFLRNGWYTENYASRIAGAVETGVLFGSAGQGRVASAARANYAAAAVAALTGTGHENKIYELSGDTAWSFPELAATVAEVAGKAVEYQDIPLEKFAEVLQSAGLPGPAAAFFAALDVEISQGALAATTGDLSTLIGRKTTPVRETVAAIVKG
ncbi:MAG TPA: SDR family oxidoreductase [Pseudonocardiaceae bacterium]|jgi:NAD(P)H dehydrogenase (quinone)|nr:SDR family oxidoreductase [Pseudonocardiaceae bacterium]